MSFVYVCSTLEAILAQHQSGVVSSGSTPQPLTSCARAHAVMKDSRGASNADDSPSRATSALSIDPRSPTPSLRFGDIGAYGGAGNSRPSLSSRTPTPQQWAREYALRGQNSDMPTRSSTSMGGPPPPATLDLCQRPMSVQEVRTLGGINSQSIPQVTTRPEALMSVDQGGGSRPGTVPALTLELWCFGFLVFWSLRSIGSIVYIEKRHTLR